MTDNKFKSHKQKTELALFKEYQDEIQREIDTYLEMKNELKSDNDIFGRDPNQTAQANHTSINNAYFYTNNTYSTPPTTQTNTPFCTTSLNREQEIYNQLNYIRNNFYYNNILPLPEMPYIYKRFPLNYLPGWTSDLVSQVASSLRVSIEAVAPALIGAIFIGARGNYMIKVKNNYHEPLTNYIVAAIESGGRKSAIVDFFRKPIIEIENELKITFDTESPSHKNYLEAKNAIKKRIKSKALTNLNVESPQENLIAINQLRDKLDALEKESQCSIFRPKLLIDSPTTKELAMEMARQNEAIGIFEAEAGIWKHRVRSSDDNIYLKGYTMEPFGNETTVNSVTMQKPCLAICSYVQRNIAEKLYSNIALKDDGLLPRILPVFIPKYNNFLHQNQIDISDEIVEKYSNKIKSLFSIKRPTGQSGERTFHVIELTNEAQAAWREYTTSIIQNINTGYYRDCESFGEKLAGHAVRLAGAIHLLKHDIPHNHKIDHNTMHSGIQLADYFSAHAMAVFDENSRINFDLAKKILAWVNRSNEWYFTTRNLNRHLGHHKMVNIQPSIDILQQYGYITCHSINKSKYCIVNPKYILNNSIIDNPKRIIPIW